MCSTGKVFILTGLVLCALLMLHWLPTFSFAGFETRPVDMFCDITDTENSQPAATPTAEEVAEAKAKALAKVELYHPKGVTLIEDFSDGEAGGMAHFYEKLLAGPRNHAVHIAYFGDSFIEGDILTCDLRALLQGKYGGSGPGWVDCGGSLAAYRPTVTTRHSGLTERLVTKKPFDGSLQAISQRYFTPQPGATVRYQPTDYREHLSPWTEAQLFFRTSSGVSISTTVNGTETDSRQFEASPRTQVLSKKGDITQIAYRLPSGNARTQLLGTTLDGKNGIRLDNFSMRGSAGFTLASIPLTTLRDMNELRPYDLIVIQFGLNATTATSTDKQCKAYCDKMKKVVEVMHEAFPQASILISSVGDRVQRSAGGFKTLGGIPRMVNAQREMARECGVGFLNMLETMGGPGSMKTYVDKGWAAKDYTHLSFKGGKQLANHIYQSILAGVENHRRMKEATE